MEVKQKIMEKSVKITLIVAVAVVLALAIVSFGFYRTVNPDSGQTITVDGISTIQVTPDLVTVHFNIETTGKTASEAKDANSVILDKLVTEMVKIGFNRADVQTESLNIYPWQEWDGDSYVDKGYKASHQVKIVLNTTDASKISDTIDAGVDAGAWLSYINFELSDAKQSQYKAQALTQAGEDAKMKAKAIADGLGLKVGSKPISVSTSSFNYRPWMVYSASADSSAGVNAQEAKAATNIVAGSQDVTGQIQVVYKLY